MKKLIYQYTTTGIQISKYQLNKLSNNQLKSYFNVRVRTTNMVGYELIRLNELSKEVTNKYLGKLSKPEVKYLLEDGDNDTDVIIDMLLVNEKYLSNIGSEGISDLIEYSNNKDQLIYKLLGREDLISRVGASGVSSILGYATEPDSIIETLLNKPDFVNSLDDGSIASLLSASKDPDNTINILFSKEVFDKNSYPTIIEHLLYYSSEPERIIKMLGGKGQEYMVNLHDRNIRNLFNYTKDPDKLINVLLGNSDFVSNLTIEKLVPILKVSESPEMVLTTLGDKGETLLNELTTYLVRNRLLPAKNGDELFDVLFNNKVFLSNVSSADNSSLLSEILWYVKNPNNLIKKILSSPEIMTNISEQNALGMLEFSDEPEKLMKIGWFGDYLKSLISSYSLTEFKVKNMLTRSPVPGRLLTLLGEKGQEHMSEIDIYGLDSLFKSENIKNNSDSFIDVLLNDQKFLNSIDGDKMGTLLTNMSEPEKLFNKLGDRGVDLAENGTSTRLLHTIKRAKSPEKLLPLLGDKGASLMNKFRDSLEDERNSRYKVHDLLYSVKNTDEFVKLLLNDGGEYKEKMTVQSFSGFLTYLETPKIIIDYVGDRVEFLIQGLGFHNLIKQTIIDAKSPKDVIEILGKEGEEYKSLLTFNKITENIARSKSGIAALKYLRAIGEKGEEFIKTISTNKARFKKLLSETREPFILPVILSEEKVSQLVRSMSVDEAREIYLNSDERGNLAGFLKDYNFPDFTDY